MVFFTAEDVGTTLSELILKTSYLLGVGGNVFKVGLVFKNM